ncbi:MAG: hypothetical protein CVT66_06250 [Actinobacteria bacterium HGW-Actinobacteria-6]|nr:MAG: hypothetical protein CVT66_06250 [Actinobacteria bacterium HGW-Actinobacteria-6]
MGSFREEILKLTEGHRTHTGEAQVTTTEPDIRHADEPERPRPKPRKRATLTPKAKLSPETKDPSPEH